MRGIAGFKAALKQRAFRIAFVTALPVAITGALIKKLDNDYDFLHKFMPDEKVYGMFFGLIAFLLVFRTGHAYARFAEGVSLVHQMTADFTDATSVLLSLARLSDTSPDAKDRFGQVAVRLVSALSALCMADLSNLNVESVDVLSHVILDLGGLHGATLDAVDGSTCKADVICHLLQNLIADSLGDVLKGAPPPLLTRVWQELNGGMRHYHNALKFNHVPFPFPFLAVVEVLLVAHSAFTPFMMAIYVKGIMGTACFSFGFNFFVWVMYGLQTELDNPFGDDLNDIEMVSVQDDLNRRLVALLNNSNSKTPSLSANAADLKKQKLEPSAPEENPGDVRIQIRQLSNVSIAISGQLSGRSRSSGSKEELIEGGESLQLPKVHVADKVSGAQIQNLLGNSPVLGHDAEPDNDRPVSDHIDRTGVAKFAQDADFAAPPQNTLAKRREDASRSAGQSVADGKAIMGDDSECIDGVCEGTGKSSLSTKRTLDLTISRI